MPRYADERREAVVVKLLPPRNLNVSEVAAQEGILVGTVYKQRKEAREQGHCLPNAGDGGAAAWSSKDKFGTVLETMPMNAEQIAEYCRSRGLYPQQIPAWRLDCEQAANLSLQDEAKQALQRARQIESNLNMDFVRQALPVADAASAEHFYGGLIKAGVPERGE